MKLYSLFGVVNITECENVDINLEVKGVTSNSKKVKSGYIFVCIDGLHVNGHDHIDEALDNGAVLIIASQKKHLDNSNKPYCIVKDTRKALALVCGLFYGNPQKKLKITAVTGTNGKTTTVMLLSKIFEKAGIKHRVIGTLNGEMTTPDTEELYSIFDCALKEGATDIIMEASSHALALDKLYNIDFVGAVYTNLTHEHLDFHDDMLCYASAKAKLFEHSKISLINVDDKYSDVMLKSADREKYTYSLKNKNADFYAEKIKTDLTHGISFDVVYKDKIKKIENSLRGDFNVCNTLAAFSYAILYGIDEDIAHSALCEAKCVKGRLEKIDTDEDDISVFIDYAHTPDALENVLSTVRRSSSEKTKITVLFGCGGDRDKTKRSIMGAIASRYADFTVITSDNNRHEDREKIILDILRGVDKEKPFIVISDRKEAIEYTILNAKKGEIVILAGKGHEEYEICGDVKSYFSEREIAKSALKKRRFIKESETKNDC